MIAPWCQAEITSVCQAGCVDCNRQRPHQGYESFWTNPHQSTEWQLNPHLADSRSMYPVADWHSHIAQWPHLRHLQFCGNIGDPMAHPHISDCVASVLEHHPHCHVDISTNGALGRLTEWDRLAKLNCTVTFAVDGLEDTNHIYRRGVDWHRVRERMTRFIEQGGTAWWQWVEFPWNTHQIDRARALAESWGFESFDVSQRFTPTQQFDNEIVRVHTEPVSTRHHQPQQFTDDQLRLNHHERVNQLRSHTVDPGCVNYDAHSKYHHPMPHINVDGTVWPCCYMATVPFHSAQHEQWWYQQSVADVGVTWNSLYHHTLEEIVTSEWWQKILPQSWHAQDHTGSSICRQHCGKCL